MFNGKYGETNQTMIPRNAAWQCATCKKHIPHTLTCEMYPEQIPEEIIFGDKICKDREPKEPASKK